MARRLPPRYDLPNAAPGSLRLVQEFLNTGDKEHGREWLDSPAALKRWLRERDLVRPSARVTQADLDGAQLTREALRELVRLNCGEGPTENATRQLDRVAVDARVTIRFDATGEVRLEAAAPGVAGALGTVLARVHENVVMGRWQRLKACPNCSWAFYDTSPNRSAKWCSMLLCGNRSKVGAYYRRRTRAQAPPKTDVHD